MGNLTLSGEKFYGLTSFGGANNRGVIFEWNPSTNIYTKKIDFSNAEGGKPYGNSSLTPYNGKFYGMTVGGGANDKGVIFEWNPSTNIYTKKMDFDGLNGSYPAISLTLLNDKFYGITNMGGIDDLGVIFEWDPHTNIYTKKMDFIGINPGGHISNLTLSGGKFYGMNFNSGANSIGCIFE
jgi:uncharacterized repeat protein (TIGR03803 family)